MSARRITTALVLSLTLMAGVASANDPISMSLLSKISQVLVAIEKIELAVLKFRVESVYNRMRFFAWPVFMRDPIPSVMQPVHGVRNLLDRITCGFWFSPRTEPFRRLYQATTRVAHTDVRRLWGQALGSGAILDQVTLKRLYGSSAEMDELYGYNSELLYNAISTREQSEAIWTRVFNEAYPTLTSPTTSTAGEAQRWEAMLLAMDGQVAAANNQLQVQALSLERLDFDDQRAQERGEADFVMALANARIGGTP